MVKLLYKIKNNKLLAGIIFGVFCVILLDLFVIIFDIIQFIKLSKNTVDFMSAFMPLNILAGVINIVAVGVIVFYVIFRKRNLKAVVSKRD